MSTTKNNKKVADALVQWYRKNARDLPWRHTTDPYAIWVSEIILQQTTVAQGKAYYDRFLRSFPDIKSLAEAPLDEVLKLWEGLGYYSRARNIHYASIDIMQRFGGRFPTTYKDIISLKGIGPYAAAAIGSFAYGLPHVVVDGNVLRVMSRLYGYQEAVDLPGTKKKIQNQAQALLETQNPAEFNQTIMEFGALNCTYKNPVCEACILKRHCVAFKENLVQTLPAKSKKIIKRKRYFHFLVIASDKRIVTQQRQERDIWKGLYQFPLIEKEKKNESLALEDLSLYLGTTERELLVSKEYKQTLTHQYIIARFYRIAVELGDINKEVATISRKDIGDYPWPKIINNYLQESGLLN